MEAKVRVTYHDGGKMTRKPVIAVRLKGKSYGIEAYVKDDELPVSGFLTPNNKIILYFTDKKLECVVDTLDKFSTFVLGESVQMTQFDVVPCLNTR